jgi:hypothetical protein
MKRVAGLAVCVASLLTTAAAADSGYVAHPDLPGTETLRVAGSVERYDMRNGRVTLIVRDGRCQKVTWTPGAADARTSSACVGAAAPATAAQSGDVRVTLRSGSGDQPDRLLVSDGTRNRSWPLPERAFHVDVDGRTAVFSTRASREVYAINIDSGHVALVGLTRHLDTPRLDADGLLFRDNVFKRRENDGATLLKFIPRRHVDAATRRVGRPLRVDGEIADLAMDGSRVALAVRQWQGECDAVVYWNITWNYAIPITEDEERTCAWSHRGGSIQSVSLAGLRAAWVMRVGSQERLVSASSVDCFERRVVTAQTDAGDRLARGAGDGGLLAYLVTSKRGNVVGKLDGRMRGETIASEQRAPVMVATDGGRVALLLANGVVRIRNASGADVGTIPVGAARAIALQGQSLVTLTRQDTLDVYDATSGSRLHSWPVPAGVSARIDTHFGIAVLTQGGSVHAVSLATGKRVLVARVAAPAVAAIEATGVAYASTRGRGVVGFVWFADLERALRAAR